jgi:glycosyltransferase involved in cell wall biosynthesis
VREFVAMRPDWQFVFIGPVVKIKRETLPTGPNVQYLGLKKYEELPAYFHNWDVAILPFARNESTRFISPTKTPEYLAAGLPAVSTSIRDVVRTYGNADFVQIADTAAEFERAIDKALRGQHPADWTAIDEFLQDNSWDKTWAEMNRLIQARVRLMTEQ